MPVNVACPLEGTWPFAHVLGGVLMAGRVGAEGVWGGEVRGTGEGALGIAGAAVTVVMGGMVITGSWSPAMSLLLPLWLPSLAV